MAEAATVVKTARPKKQSEFVRVFKELRKNSTAMLGLCILLVEIILVILAPVIAPYDYTAMDIVAAQQGPSAAHWFGTDELGRDIFSRVLYGGRYSISMGVLAVMISTTVGMTIGAIAGYFGGIVDSIPLAHALADGCTKAVVVLTRNAGYRKKIQGTRVPSFIYKKYPLLQQAINRRSVVYNGQLDLVERLEVEGQAVVIRPQQPVQVDRIERDVHKLTALYDEGYRCGMELECL